MIHITDSLLLAYTKLRARKVRLIVTIVISSLLFSLLAVGSFVVRGIVGSADSFSKEGFGSRYILGASPVASPNVYDNPDILTKAIALQKEEVARKKVEAKRLGIEYDANSERLVYFDGEGPNGKIRSLDAAHPLSLKVIREHLAQNPQPGINELKKLSAPYGATAFYESRYSAFQNPDGSQLKLLKEGKESFEEQGQEQPGNPFIRGLDSFNTGWTLTSGDLLKTFTLDGSNGLNQTDGIVPVVAPYSAVEQLLRLSPLPASATSKAKLERIKEVRAKASTIEFAVCYRNQASNELINQALNVKREIEQNKNNKDYQKPSLIYDLPTEPCSAARISRDVRTAEEKALASKQQTFEELFGKQPPKQETLRFKVIGIAPDPPGFTSAFIDGLISMVLTSNIGTGWFTPLEYKEQNTLIKELFPDTQLFGQPNSYSVELPSASEAKRMLDQANCNPDPFTGEAVVSEGGAKVFDVGSEVAKCTAEGKHFFINPFGSSSLAIDSLKTGFEKVLRIAAIVISIIAGLILMGTLGRIIADARRETAVFRAIGAKRLDIAQIYITYTVIIVLLITIVSLVIGFGLAQIAEVKWGNRFTISALVAYNSQDLTRQFHLYGWYTKDILFIAATVFISGMASAIIPLLRNLRRNPIRDMRDEN